MAGAIVTNSAEVLRAGALGVAILPIWAVADDLRIDASAACCGNGRRWRASSMRSNRVTAASRPR